MPDPLDLDFAALEAAGIADARRRAGLIGYLRGLGFTVDQMAEAEHRGRLFGLAGDAVGWSGPPAHSLRSAAAALDLPMADVERAWDMLGLTVTDPDAPELTAADVDAVATWAAIRDRIGDAGAEGLLRIVGATVARLAEAESSMIRELRPDIWLDHSHDELVTARAWRETVELVPRIEAMINAIHRHHLVGARTFLEELRSGPSATTVAGVGFADLTGFTALTQLLTRAELAALVTEFGATVTDVVRAAGGRVVKFIGDAVMWVTSSPDPLADAAFRLVDHPRASEIGMRVRVGLGYGEILAVFGDYFGTPVNLAARLVDAAEPGQVLASTDVVDGLHGRPVKALTPLSLKGFDAPITPYEIQRATGDGD